MYLKYFLIDLHKDKVVIVGNEPYDNENEISDIAIATKKQILCLQNF